MKNPTPFQTKHIQEIISNLDIYTINGKVIQVTESIIRAIAPNVKIGEICYLRNIGDENLIPAEVIGFKGNIVLLAPVSDIAGVSNTTEVLPSGGPLKVRVGDGLLGCVLDGLGNILETSSDESPLLQHKYKVTAIPPNPLTRNIIQKPVVTGIRAIDSMLTLGEGQRIGLFAGAGIGKSTLLGMLAKNSDVDVIVVALIGERGKEVREFIQTNLTAESKSKSVIIVATSDKPSIERIKAAHTATAVAEYFRDKGQRVLLVMDSLTRFARALREVGIAMGEAPVSRGFPPSVFTELPKLVERAGQSDKGSITAVYTILTEGDDLSADPIADEAVSLLDGHIVLSREIANAGHYPAIDILNSLSRVMKTIVDVDHLHDANKIRKLLAEYKEIEFLVKVGEYEKGSNADADEALEKHAEINAFLQQDFNEMYLFNETRDALQDIARK